MIDPLYGKPPHIVAQWKLVEQLAQEGRHEEREVAAWELAAMMMEQTLP